MKKLLALALALVMALSVTAVAFAEGSGDPQYKCPICKAVFQTADELDAHMSAVHPAHNLTCPNCGQIFTDEKAYNDHLKLCKPEDERLVCPKCGKAFVDEALYNDHVANCTWGDEPDYINLTVKDLLNLIVDVAKSSMSQWDGIESVVIRIVDFIENVGKTAVGKDGVEGAVDDLGKKLEDAKLFDKTPSLDAFKDLKLDFDKSKLPTCKELFEALKEKLTCPCLKKTTTTVTVSETEPEPAETGSSSVGIAVFAAVSVAAAAAYVCMKKKAD